MALGKLSEEDPTFRVKSDEETGQTIISGMGELHLDIIMDRLKREFKVEVNWVYPRLLARKPSLVPYSTVKLIRNKPVVVVNLPIYKLLYRLMTKVRKVYNL